MPSSCVTKFNTVSHTREERATASHRMVWRNARHAHKVCRLVRPLNVPLAIAEIELELKSLRRIHARQAHQPGYLHHAFHQTFDTCVHHAQDCHGHQAIERAARYCGNLVVVEVPVARSTS